MRRAKTLTGLFLQAARVRWNALGKGAKLLVLASLVLTGLAAVQLGTCLLGGCPASSSPCHGAAAAEGDSPCPYAGRRSAPAATPEEAPASAEQPPCHAR
jgi:hypothetical protein